jgi:hypothetical protein
MPDKKIQPTQTPASIQYQKASDLSKKIRPSIMQKESRSRIKRLDVPLASTPEPTYIDNTYIKKPIVKNK